MGRKRYREKEMSIYSSPLYPLLSESTHPTLTSSSSSPFPFSRLLRKKTKTKSLEARNSWLVRSRYVAGTCPPSLSKIRSSEFLKYRVSSLVPRQPLAGVDPLILVEPFKAISRHDGYDEFCARVCWDSIVSIYLRVSLQWLNYFSRSIGYKDLSSIAK